MIKKYWTTREIGGVAVVGTAHQNRNGVEVDFRLGESPNYRPDLYPPPQLPEKWGALIIKPSAGVRVEPLAIAVDTVGQWEWNSARLVDVRGVSGEWRGVRISVTQESWLMRSPEGIAAMAQEKERRIAAAREEEKQRVAEICSLDAEEVAARVERRGLASPVPDRHRAAVVAAAASLWGNRTWRGASDATQQAVIAHVEHLFPRPEMRVRKERGNAFSAGRPATVIASPGGYAVEDTVRDAATATRSAAVE